MKVSRVEYRKLVTGPDYGNETYGVVVDLEPGDTEESAMRFAKGTVENWFEGGKELKNERAELNAAQWRVSELYREIQRRQSTISTLKKYEDRLRDRLAMPPVDDIPF